MTAKRSILAATDFSTPSRHAVDRAALLAAEAGARLTLVHTVSRRALDGLRLWLGAGHPSEPEMLADAQSSLDQLARELTTAHPGIRLESTLATGVPPDEITLVGDRVDADLAVVGARGSGVLRRMALGSTAERLLRRTTRPLLVVKQSPSGPYRRVLVAVDFSASSPGVLHAARQVAPGARLVLLTVYQVPFEGKLRFAGVDDATIDHYRQQARREVTGQLQVLARDFGLQEDEWDACIVEGDPWIRIVEKEQELDCDLIAMGKHGQSAAEELLLGSVTSTVLAEGTADVLVSAAPARDSV